MIAKTPAAHAQQAASTLVTVSVPAGSLENALLTLGRQANLRLLYASSLTAGKVTSGVSGQLSPQTAVERILSRTGLSYTFTAANTVRILDPSAGANNAAATVDGAIALDTIDVSGGSRVNTPGGDPDAQFRSPVSSANYTEEKIQRFRGTSPGDFLKGAPGIMVGDLRNSGAVDVNIRGMQGMDRVPITIDGAQQSNTVYRGYAGVGTRTYVDPDLIGGATIEKGPTAGPEGAGATGGLVRLRTISADDILLDGKSYGIRLRGGLLGNTTSVPETGTTRGIDASLMDKTYGPSALPEFGNPGGFDRPAFLEPTSGFGSIATAVRGDNIEAVAAYTRRSAGNYYAGKNGDDGGHVVLTPQGSDISAKLAGLTPYRAGEEILNTSNDSESYLLKGALKLDGGHKVELSYMNYQSNFTQIFPSNLYWPGGPYQNSPSAVEVDTYTATHTWRPSDNKLIDYRLNVWKTSTHFHLGNSYPMLAYIGLPLIWENLSVVDAGRWGANISNTSRFDTSVGDVALTYGLSFTSEDMRQYNTTEELPGFLPATEEKGRSGWRNETSAFMSAEWTPYDWLKVDGALRYTLTRSHDNCAAPPTMGSCQEDLENAGLAPIGAITVEPWKGFQAYVRYAEAIRSPSLYESTVGESFVVSPALNLVPEHARSWELGINVLREDVFMAGDKFRFKAAYFHNNVDNYLTRTYGDPAKGEGWAVLRNLDSALFKGIELSAVYDMGRFFGELGYTYYLDTMFCLKEEDFAAFQEGNVIAAGEARCNAGGVGGGYAQMHVPPKSMATLTLGARLLEQALTVGTRVTVVGERPVEGTGSPTSGGFTVLTEWRPYTLVDLFATWKLNDNLQAEFNIDNLGDFYYVDALSVGVVPSPGRTARAGLTLKF